MSEPRMREHDTQQASVLCTSLSCLSLRPVNGERSSPWAVESGRVGTRATPPGPPGPGKVLAHSRSLVLLKAYVCRRRAGFWIKARVRRTKQCGAGSQGLCSVTGEPSSRCITGCSKCHLGKMCTSPAWPRAGRGAGEWGPERPPGSVCRGPVGRESRKRAVLSGWPLCSSAFGAYLGSVARNGIINGSCPSCLLEEIRAEKKSVQQCKHPCTQWR